MEVFKAIKERRAIRRYKQKPVPLKYLHKLIDIARYAPSPKNIQNWEFIIVRDRKRIEELSEVHHYARFIKAAPAVIAVTVKPLKQYGYKYDALFSAATATENLMIAARALGLGTCWVFVKSDDPRPEARVKKILSIPRDVSVLCLVPVGYPAEKPSKKFLYPLKRHIFYEKYQIEKRWTEQISLGRGYAIKRE